jgi:hypothetical protein
MKNFLEFYIESAVPFDKRREIRKGLKKKYGNKLFKPYTFGFDIEFTITRDMDEVRDYLDHINIEYDNDDDYKLYVNGLYKKQKQDLDYDDIDDWESDHPEPDEDDYYDEDDWTTDYNTWYSQRESLEETLAENNNLLEDLKETGQEEYIKQILSNGKWEEYFPNEGGQIEGDIEYVSEQIEEILSSYDIDPDDFTWEVHEDETRNIEIVSPILRTKDIPIAMEVLNNLNIGEAGAGTSAHVHIGLPETFDYFDLLVLYDLVDEDTINKVEPDRARGYTELKNVMYRQLAIFLNTYERGSDIDVGDFRKIQTEKRMGVNISKVSGGVVDSNKKGDKSKSGKGRTIEFRYLSSRILDDTEQFFEWIEYYMTLVKLAESRGRFKFQHSDQTYVLTRISKNKIHYDDHETGRPYEKQTDIKDTISKSDNRKVMLKELSDIHKDLPSNLKIKYPLPDINNMSNAQIDKFLLQNSELAHWYVSGKRFNNKDYEIPKEFIEKISEDVLQGIKLVTQTRTGLRRNFVVENKLLNTPESQLDENNIIRYTIAMALYLQHLYRQDYFKHFDVEITNKIRNTKDLGEARRLFKGVLDNNDK